MPSKVVRRSLFGKSLPTSSSLDPKMKFVSELNSFGVESKVNETVDGVTYDVLVPQLGTVVNFDPTSTHNSYTAGVASDFHRSVTRKANKSGLSCIHVFDWDDVSKLALMLSPKKSVFARKCSIEKVDQSTANVFLGLYHLQGSARGQTACYGMYYDGKLVSVMTFGKPRYNKSYQWELIRLCYHPSYRVVGGSERMWKHFLSDERPRSVLSYCDSSKFTGSVYYKLGMTLKSEGLPSKHWYSESETERSKHITNNFLLQHGYDQIFRTNFGKGTSNEKLITERGYLPIYDCGQMTFEWKSDSYDDKMSVNV